MEKVSMTCPNSGADGCAGMACYTMRIQTWLRFSLYMPLAPLEFAYCLIPREIICNASSRLCLLRTSHASLRCPRCLKSPDESVYSWNALRNSGSFIGVFEIQSDEYLLF